MNFAAPLFVLASTVGMIGPTQNEAPANVKALIQQFEKAFIQRKLGEFHPGRHRISISIFHSLRDVEEHRTFKSFSALETWLKAREIDGMPSREVLGTYNYHKGVVTYEFYGINHNTLYVNSLRISMQGSTPMISHISLEDGD